MRATTGISWGSSLAARTGEGSCRNGYALVRRRWTTVVMVLGMSVLCSHCNQSANERFGRAPHIDSEKPTTVTAGTPGFDLMLTGTNFFSSVGMVNNQAVPTITLSSTQADLQVPANMIATPGTLNVSLADTTVGGVLKSNTVTVMVTGGAPPNFTILAMPSSQTVIQGAGTSYTVTIGALNGFTGNVTLSQSGLPGGASGLFNPPSVTGSGSSTLTVMTMASTPTGSSTVTVKGTSGSLSHTATVMLVVNTPPPPPDFTISAMPSSQTVNQGAGTSYTATIGALNGFTGNVTLSQSGLPGGASGTFNPPSVTGAGSSTLTVMTMASTPTGSSTVTVMGTSGSLSHTATVTLTVNPLIGEFLQVTNGGADSFLATTSSGDPFVAFASLASNLVPGDTNNNADAFEACIPGGAVTSCPTPIARVSLDIMGNQLGLGIVSPPGGQIQASPISGDGHFVGFVSADPNVFPGAPGSMQVYLRFTCWLLPSPPCMSLTTVASLDSRGLPATQGAMSPALSANARVVAFFSGDFNIVPPASGFQVYARDLCLGAPTGCVPKNVLVSEDNSLNKGNGFSDHPAVSDDGRWVAFESSSSNLVPGITSIMQDIFVHDTCIGAPAGCVPSTTLVSASQAGSPIINGNGFSQNPSINGDGRFVVFQSQASNILPGITAGGRPDVFLRDTCGGSSGPVTGCIPTTTRVSQALNGTQANNLSLTNPGERTISSTGRLIAFVSGATNLLPTPSTPGQIYVLDTCFGAPTGCAPALHKATVDSTGMEVGSSGQFSLSGDGTYVAYTRLVGTPTIQQIFLAFTGF